MSDIVLVYNDLIVTKYEHNFLGIIRAISDCLHSTGMIEFDQKRYGNGRQSMMEFIEKMYENQLVDEFRKSLLEQYVEKSQRNLTANNILLSY